MRVYQINGQKTQAVRVSVGLPGQNGVSGLLTIGAATIPASGSVALTVTPTIPTGVSLEILVSTTSGTVQGTLLNGTFTRRFAGSVATVAANSLGFVIATPLPQNTFPTIAGTGLPAGFLGMFDIDPVSYGVLFINSLGQSSLIPGTKPQVFNVATGAGLPPGWTFWTPTFNIWFDETDVPMANHIGGTQYWVSPTGNDSNAGTSAGAPLRTIAEAIRKIDLVAGTNNNFTVNVAPGIYYQTDWRTTNGRTPFLENFALVGTGTSPNDVILTGSADPSTFTWTNNGNGTFTLTLATAPQSAIDMDAIDSDGQFTRLTPRASAAAVQAAAEGVFISGNSITIKRPNGQPPGTRVLVPTVWSGGGLQLINFYSYRSYFANLCFAGVGLSLAPTSASTVENHRVFNCRFTGMRSGSTDAISVRSDFSAVNSFFYFKNVRVSYSHNDGFNYNGSGCFALEDNCIVNFAGFENLGTNQSSTGHAGSTIIRVDGTYRNSGGQNIADVQGSNTWIINCRLLNNLSLNNIDSDSAWIDHSTITPNTFAAAPDVYRVRKTLAPAQGNITTYS